MVRLRLWYIPPILTIICAAFVTGARSIGASNTVLFNCVILGGGNSAFVAVDANRQLETAIKAVPSKTYQVIASPNGKYSVLKQDSNVVSGVAGSLAIRTNASQQIVQLPDLELVRGVSWSPDNRHVALWGLSATTRSQVLLVANADGTAVQTVQVDIPSAPVWSDDSAYIAYSGLTNVIVIHVEDFVQYRIADRPQNGIQWSPHSHKIIYMWGQSVASNLKIYDMDTQDETSYSFSLQPGSRLAFTETPDGRYVAVYQDSGQAKKQLTIFDLSTGQEVDTDAKGKSFSTLFWTPDSRAIVIVTDDRRALMAFYIAEQRSEVLVPDGFKNLIPTTDSNRYLFLRQQDSSVSLNLLNIGTHQVSLIKDNVVYISDAQFPPDNTSFFVIQQVNGAYSVDILNAVTDEQLHIIDSLPSQPQVREVAGSIVVIIWETSSGGGLARYSIADKTLSFYHVDIIPGSDSTKTRFSFSPDHQHVAVGVQEPNAISLQIASLDSPSPIKLYQSANAANWTGMMYWSPDSSELLYGIANGGPVKLVQSDGSELRTFSQNVDVGFSTCSDYFDN